MNVNEAARFLNYYLDENLDAEYALMLTGPWGAGKTHFIKRYLDDRASRMGNTEKRGYLYASLFGITSTTAITDQFFAQAHPVLNSKTARLLGAFASKALNGIAGTDVNTQSENHDVLKEMVLRLEGKILVFDDLERCSMGVADVLGFINNYVEHEGLKVIILANEYDIPAEQMVTYKRQKEKIVGKTIQVESDPEEVLDKLIQRIKINEVRQVVISAKARLLNTFLASGKTNFRNLRAILAEFERLISAVDTRLSNAPEAMTQLLLYMVATGNEFRSGDLDSETFRAIPTTQYYSSGNPDNPEMLALMSIFEKLKSRYLEVQWFDPIIAPIYLANLYAAGVIEVGAINAALAQHPAVVGHSETPPWRLLWDWTNLSRCEYSQARSRLLDQLSNHEITHPGVILQVVGTVLSLEDFGDELLGVGADVKVYFEHYMERLLTEQTLEISRTTFGMMAIGHASLGYPCKDSEKFRTIHTLVEKAHIQQCARQMEDIAKVYILRLRENSDAYSSLYESGIEAGGYATSALLQHLDISEFASLLVEGSRPNDRLFASLSLRYEGEQYNSYRLRGEYCWLHDLNQELTDRAQLELPPHRQLLTMRIGYYFGKIFGVIIPTS